MKYFLILSLLFSSFSMAAEPKKPAPKAPPSKKIVYQGNQTLDFEGLALEGELKAPGEFYFQNRNQERFDSLTKRRVNFRREMLRDSIQSN